MKRTGNLYQQIISIENLMLADNKARRGKLKSRGVIVHDANRVSNILRLHNQLADKSFRMSDYHVFRMITDNNKEREIYRLPYYPDRILHHAIMNVMEPIWVSLFTNDTYACIKNRGIHLAMVRLKRALKTDPDNTVYCLKMDIRKFYPSIDHETLKALLRKKLKDNDLLWLLDMIIDSAPGVPIGNYLSQYFANVYLSYFDHWLKEEKHVHYYFRYADDMVILHSDKAYLHNIRNDISGYLMQELKLQLKDNYQVFPVEKRGIDYLGYKFYHTHTLLRKSIKQHFCRKVAAMKKAGKNAEDVRLATCSWKGWAVHCNSRNLLTKLSA